MQRRLENSAPSSSCLTENTDQVLLRGPPGLDLHPGQHHDSIIRHQSLPSCCTGCYRDFFLTVFRESESLRRQEVTSVRSLVVQGLGLQAFTAEGPGSIPGQGTKIQKSESWRAEWVWPRLGLSVIPELWKTKGK